MPERALIWYNQIRRSAAEWFWTVIEDRKKRCSPVVNLPVTGLVVLMLFVIGGPAYQVAMAQDDMEPGLRSRRLRRWAAFPRTWPCPGMSECPARRRRNWGAVADLPIQSADPFSRAERGGPEVAAAVLAAPLRSD